MVISDSARALIIGRKQQANASEFRFSNFLAMQVKVLVREVSLTIDCGSAEQTVQWLATVAAQRYARLHRLDEAAVGIVQVTRKKDDSFAMPYAILSSELKDDPGAVLCVHLTGSQFVAPALTYASHRTLHQLQRPTAHIDRQQGRSMWQRFADVPTHLYKSMLLILDRRDVFKDRLAEQQQKDRLKKTQNEYPRPGRERQRASNRSGTKQSRALKQVDEKHLDSSNVSRERVVVVGNFTNWVRPIRMDFDSQEPGLYYANIQVPPDTLLVFKFGVIELDSMGRDINSQQWVVSNAHIVGSDATGTDCNLIPVNANVEEDDDELISSAGPAKQKREAVLLCERFTRLRFPPIDLQALGHKALQQFARMETLTLQERRAVFEREWNQMVTPIRVTKQQKTTSQAVLTVSEENPAGVLISEIDDLDNVEDSEPLKRILWERYELICQAFKYYSCSGDDELMMMSNVEFWSFCQRCLLTSNMFTLKQASEIFWDINREHNEQKKAEEIRRSTLDEKAKAEAEAKAVYDATLPEHQFNRAEFMDGLVRLAQFKYMGSLPTREGNDASNEAIMQHTKEALENLLKYHVEPYALRPWGRDTIREKLQQEPVQRLYEQYQTQLRRLYQRYSDKADDDSLQGEAKYRASSTINFTEFKLMLRDLNVTVDGTAADGLMEDVVAAGRSSAWLSSSARGAGSNPVALLFMISQADEDTPTNPATEMVYSEYLEALARLAEMRYKAKHPLHVKLGRLFHEYLFPPSTSSRPVA